MCEDINVFVTAVDARGVQCADIEDRGWGLLSSLTRPGSGSLGIYQPRHARPPNL